MGVRFSALAERLRSSLFFVPMLFVVAAVVVGEAALTLDEAIGDSATDWPLRLSSTVDNARAILSTVAGATITFAGIAFSVALLVVQLASSQYSPRIVHGLFRDPFNKRVMGFVVGTFTYCLVVLRSVRDAVEDGGESIVPHLSVGLAVLLGVAAVLAIVAFIDHAAHNMDVSKILQGVTDDTLDGVDRTAPDDDEPVDTEEPTGDGLIVRFTENGWVQQIDQGALLDLASQGGAVLLHSTPGRYAIAGTPLCTIWSPADPGDTDRLEARARAAVHLGDTRTMQQDLSYGLRQIVDVALRALSPGVNDPTTAQDAIFHVTAVLHALLRAPQPDAVAGEEGRRLLMPEVERPRDLIGVAFDEIRLAAAPHPTVCVYLLEAMCLLVDALHQDGLGALAEPVKEQANLVVLGTEAADLPERDVARVRAAYAKRFLAPESGRVT